MGFLKNIFKRKEGGTFVGNLIRGGSSAMTGGILGSGAGLNAWEQRQANQQVQQMDGKAIGQDLVRNVAVPNMVNSPGATNPNIGESVFMETVKKRWAYGLGAIAVIGGGFYLLGNRKKGNKKVK